jgi:hypothetical protein
MSYAEMMRIVRPGEVVQASALPQQREAPEFTGPL